LFPTHNLSPEVGGRIDISHFSTFLFGSIPHESIFACFVGSFRLIFAHVLGRSSSSTVGIKMELVRVRRVGCSTFSSVEEVSAFRRPFFLASILFFVHRSFKALSNTRVIRIRLSSVHGIAGIIFVPFTSTHVIDLDGSNTVSTNTSITLGGSKRNSYSNKSEDEDRRSNSEESSSNSENERNTRSGEGRCVPTVRILVTSESSVGSDNTGEEFIFITIGVGNLSAFPFGRIPHLFVFASLVHVLDVVSTGKSLGTIVRSEGVLVRRAITTTNSKVEEISTVFVFSRANLADCTSSIVVRITKETIRVPGVEGSNGSEWAAVLFLVPFASAKTLGFHGVKSGSSTSSLTFGVHRNGSKS